jgi:hypothetical protein
MDIRECRLKFAPRDEPALDITKGMAIAGELYMNFRPGGELQIFAGVDMGIEDLRIYAAGHLGAFALGPLVWEDALFDMNLEFGATHLIVDGQATLMGNTQQLQISMSRDSLFFHTATQIDNRFGADITARGMFNLTSPSFQVHGVMQGDFNGQFGQLMSDGISDFAGSADQAITAALNAYDQVAELHEHKQQAIDSLTVLLNAIRAAAQNEVNQARQLRDQAEAERNSARSQKNSAYNAWQSTPLRKPALRAQRHATYVAKVAVFATKAAAYATRQAAFLARQAVLDAIPSPDTDPVLQALIEQSDQLWAEMERRQQNLQQMQTMIQQVVDYLDRTGGPAVVINRAEFDANLNDLVQGNGVSLGLDLTLAGESRQDDINITFQNASSGLQPLLNAFFGTI